MEFFEHLDRAGGFYYERWGDAPVHSIGAALFAKKDQIHFFDDIGYRHEPFQVGLVLHLCALTETRDSIVRKGQLTKEGIVGVIWGTTLIGNGISDPLYKLRWTDDWFRYSCTKRFTEMF